MSDNQHASDDLVQIAQIREWVEALVASVPESVRPEARRETTNLVTALLTGSSSPEEALAGAILERVERELVSVEERTNRLMYLHGL